VTIMTLKGDNLKMQKYYLHVVLTRTNTTMSKLIRFVKKDEYTHAAISLDKELNYLYSFGRKHTYNPFLGRFKRENIDKGIYKFCETLPGVIIEIEVSSEQYKKAKYLLNYFMLNSSCYKYNYRGLIHSLLDKPVCYDNRFLCSEFVYYILKESGVVDFHIPRNLVRPQDFMVLESNIIYKGDLRKIVKTNSSNESFSALF